MSDEQARTAETVPLGEIPATEVNPEDVGTLSLRYVDGVPVLVVSGGSIIPASLTVVNESGSPIAKYAAGPASEEIGPPIGVRSSTHQGVRVNFWQGISVTDENGQDFDA
ncbi:hypothetical protein OG883_40930 [Streptomyces sp. NBC_01142]|uniref:hypothetical protein n=1 Tax=Streptomyces sp. NBC_01142 TaxID=2975865 RepID=UPI002257D830|nr:hypothetical protein [Streptomyces sp. NBC_01142]MCX4826040.1 hypothetical protein [Streptomyces sp. NBC_01142]